MSEVKRYEIPPVYMKWGVISEKADGYWVAHQDYEALRAENERLREALKRYGDHDTQCAQGYLPVGPCDCGLDAAIAGAAP